MLRRSVAVLLTAALLPMQALAVSSFPFHRYGEVPVTSLVPKMCGDEEVVEVATDPDENGVRWVAVSNHDRDMFFKVENGQVTEVVLTLTEGPLIIVSEVLDLATAQARFPGGPCQYLFPPAKEAA